MDEPSKPNPSSNASTFRRWNGTEVCCHLPIRSTNFKSTITASCFLPKSIACFGSIRCLLARRAYTGAVHLADTECLPSTARDFFAGVCRRSGDREVLGFRAVRNRSQTAQPTDGSAQRKQQTSRFQSSRSPILPVESQGPRLDRPAQPGPQTRPVAGRPGGRPDGSASLAGGVEQ